MICVQAEVSREINAAFRQFEVGSAGDDSDVDSSDLNIEMGALGDRSTYMHDVHADTFINGASAAYANNVHTSVSRSRSPSPSRQGLSELQRHRDSHLI